MVGWGGSRLLAALGIRIPAGAPRSLQAALTSLLVRVRNQSPAIRGAATGLLTTLLPCGWLYMFVATAGGTGHVSAAVAVMLFFWLGTLPMMAAVGFGAQRLFGRFERRVQCDRGSLGGSAQLVACRCSRGDTYRAHDHAAAGAEASSCAPIVFERAPPAYDATRDVLTFDVYRRLAGARRGGRGTSSRGD